MQTITITPQRQKRELMWILGCFCAAVIFNVVSIIIYKTSWTELFTQILWVLAISALLYAVTIAVRILVYLFKRFAGKKK